VRTARFNQSRVSSRLQPVTDSNCRNDINATGNITTGDVNLIKGECSLPIALTSKMILMLAAESIPELFNEWRLALTGNHFGVGARKN
jgi:hypothetical protein